MARSMSMWSDSSAMPVARVVQKPPWQGPMPSRSWRRRSSKVPLGWLAQRVGEHLAAHQLALADDLLVEAVVLALLEAVGRAT